MSNVEERAKPVLQDVDPLARLVVIFLGVIAMMLCAGLIWLENKTVPPNAALYTLAGGAVTGLAQLLTGIPRSKQRNTDTAPGQATMSLDLTANTGETSETTDTTLDEAGTQARG